MAVEVLGLALVGAGLLASQVALLAIGGMVLVQGPFWLAIRTPQRPVKSIRTADGRYRSTQVGSFSFALGLWRRTEDATVPGRRRRSRDEES